LKILALEIFKHFPSPLKQPARWGQDEQVVKRKFRPSYYQQYNNQQSIVFFQSSSTFAQPFANGWAHQARCAD
jgi:hypothetical protein